jgi:cell division protein FtsQ
VSGGLLALIAILMIVFLSAETFYVNQVEVGGLRTVPPEEIFALSGVANYHIFWIDPEVVAANVERSSSIASATVMVRWPARVIIRVKEREPALAWQQADRRYWVDVRGNLMLQRMDLPNLVTVLSEDQSVPLDCPEIGCPEGEGIAIDQAVVEGALQLKTLRPEIEVLYYNPVSGLSFDDPGGWRVYFGVGTGMQQRLLLYEAIVSNIQARGLQPEYVNVGDPDAPYYRAR